jgi:DNA-binding transcriptional LysR family regulator
VKDRLDVFYAVAEKLSFTQAAQALFISQPAVSAAIKALEAEYGLPLFSRAGGRIELTEAGATLYGYASSIRELERRAHKELSALFLLLILCWWPRKPMP